MTADTYQAVVAAPGFALGIRCSDDEITAIVLNHLEPDHSGALPELLRRAILSELQSDQSQPELQIDKPITLYLAERLGQAASEMNASSSSSPDNAPQQPLPGAAPGSIAHGQWLPSLSV